MFQNSQNTIASSDKVPLRTPIDAAYMIKSEGFKEGISDFLKVRRSVFGSSYVIFCMILKIVASFELFVVVEKTETMQFIYL